MPGTYEDPISDFGRLNAEIWRAIRLVVDTGLHSKGWTEEEAYQYFIENAAVTNQQARSEVQRYIVMPGQATSYKIGMLKIQELREKAEEELGDKFDIRAFHDTILGERCHAARDSRAPGEHLDRGCEGRRIGARLSPSEGAD